MLAPHPAGSVVHRGYSWPGLEKVSNLMGDEENAEEVKRAERDVGDVKVCSFLLLCRSITFCPFFSSLSVCFFFSFITIYFKNLSPSSSLLSLSIFFPHLFLK